MTTTTSWLSVSGTGRKTFYLGADSQGTSLASRKAVSNSVKKVFASATTPEIFAFSGAVRWGTDFLRNLLVAIRRNEISSPLGSTERANEICSLSCARVPKHPECDLEVLYGIRKGAEAAAEFQLYQLKHIADASASWQVRQIAKNKLAGPASTLVYSSGLGGKTHTSRQSWIARGDQGEVSRTCFWSLCDLVDGKPQKDIMTGGFPQLVKLDQTGAGLAVGVKYYGVPTVFGSRVNTPHEAASVWVDETFTQLKPDTLERFSGAQRYGRRKNGR